MRYLDRRNANLFDDMFDGMFRAPVMNNNEDRYSWERW